jgi:hypothetical protein
VLSGLRTSAQTCLVDPMLFAVIFGKSGNSIVTRVFPVIPSEACPSLAKDKRVEGPLLPAMHLHGRGPSTPRELRFAKFVLRSG